MIGAFSIGGKNISGDSIIDFYIQSNMNVNIFFHHKETIKIRGIDGTVQYRDDWFDDNKQ